MTAEACMSSPWSISPYSCPLCRRDTLARVSDQDNPKRAQGLQASLAELRQQRISVRQLRRRIAEMCGNCQLVMLGISSDMDQRELEIRIERSLQELGGIGRGHAA